MFYENLVWFCVRWIYVLVARRLWRADRPPVPAAASSPNKRNAPRPFKPRTPHDCPICGRSHPTPLARDVPWRERKSARGKPQTICTISYASPQPDCDYFGNADPTFHALVGDGKRGADGIQGLCCQACGKRFSSRRGTALYRLRTPAAKASPRAQPSGRPDPPRCQSRFDYRRCSFEPSSKENYTNPRYQVCLKDPPQ